MKPDLYTSPHNPPSSSKAVVVLPEIFGLNGFIKATTDKFAQELGLKAFALDHFYPVTGDNKVYDYGNHDEPMKAMQQVTGENFVDQFTTALDEIQKDDSNITDFVV